MLNKIDTTNNTSYKLAMDYFKVILEMEYNGIKVDRQQLSHLRDGEGGFREQANKCMIRIRELAGDTFNPNSWQQILTFLGGIGIKLPDTSEPTMEANVDKHEVIQLILDLRKVEKKIDYLNGYEANCDKDNLIHSTYSVLGAETLRCTSKEPNMQNVDPKLRSIFVSRFEGGKLISPDCSAIEYREIAHATQDSRLLQIFKEGKDIHRMAATMITGKKESEIDDELRREMKTCNYAACYGAGKDKFYSMIGREDKELYYKAKNLYPGVIRYKEKVKAQLYNMKSITNMFGHRRDFKEEISYSTELEAFNYLFQSACHTILKCMVIEWDQIIKDNSASDMVLLVQEGHDSVIYDTSPDCIDDVNNMIKTTNLNSLINQYLNVDMTVPMLIDSKILNRWK